MTINLLCVITAVCSSFAHLRFFLFSSVTNGHSSHEEAPLSPASGDRSPPISDGGRELQPISEDGQPPRPMSGENGRQQRPMSGEDGRQQPMSDEEDEPRSPRPVSDASSVFDGVEEPPVRRRSKVSVPVSAGRSGMEWDSMRKDLA